MADATCSVDECAKPVKGRGLCSAHYARLLRYGGPTAKPPRPSLQERLWAKVDKSGDCWLWLGWIDTYGYGILRDSERRPHKAHRVAYEDAVGPVPDGMYVDHKCHNKACVNPEHLRPVTPGQNQENHAGRARRDSTTKVRGVQLHKASGLYVARVMHRGERVFCKYFKTLEEAAEAVIEARNQFHTHNDRDRTAA